MDAMQEAHAGEQRSYSPLTSKDIEAIGAQAGLDAETRFEMKVVSTVLPFKTNRYVVDQLIDWHRVPEDPVYQITFPQRGMLEPETFERIAALVAGNAPKPTLDAAVRKERAGLNPHPAGQREMNIPEEDGAALDGIQHKYRETVLFFPSQGQTCHAYCTFCFRWAQFVGDKALKMAAKDGSALHAYLAKHPEVCDLLMTGGDPMIMKTRVLERHLGPFVDDPALAHVRNIRIGTKALTFWPQRFVSDADADAVLRLFERIVGSGRHLALMAHVNHPQELRTDIAREAIRRVRDTGAIIRTQSPLLAHVNDDPAVWAAMWREQVTLGLVPYYMFIERDTGAKPYFERPLVRCHQVFSEAIRRTSGLARTVRGPSMSATPGKVEVAGVETIAGEKVFVLRFLQGRNPEWVGRPFLAQFDAQATWLDALKPAGGANRFFFEEGAQRTGR